MGKKINADLTAVNEIIAAGGDTVKRCYQCATCSSVCPLAPDEAPFPRKQMLLAQWGFKSRLLGDPSIWLCHQCGDCTKYCPRNARPGDVLASLRLQATRELLPFKFIHTLYNNLWGLPLLILLALIIILPILFLSFQGIPNFGDPASFPYKPELHYRLTFMELPARVVMNDLIFLPLTVFIVAIMANAVGRMWRGYLETYNIPVAYHLSSLDIVKRYLAPALKEILAHSRFEKCGANAWRATPHKMLLYGFIILFVVTGTVFFLADVLGFHTPWNPITHPVKWLGYIGGLLLLYGIIGLLTGRNNAVLQNSLRTTYADSILLWLILVVGVSGFLLPLSRILNFYYNYVGYLYLIHVISVFLLFLAVPYSKFSHLVFRTTAVVFDLYYKDVVRKM